MRDPPPGLPSALVGSAAHQYPPPRHLLVGGIHHNPMRGNTNQYGFKPTKTLTDTIRARDWEAARARVITHPWDACYRAKEMRNNATPLHLACLYRAPYNLVEWILDADPRALYSQDSEGWTPLHVILLYGNDDKTAILLIRRGGSKLVSIQSQIVGAPIHLACRHGCSLAVIRELLKANPAMATKANEYSTKPARILWHQYARNPDNQPVLDGLSTTRSITTEELDENTRGLIDRLVLLLRAAKRKHHHQHFGQDQEGDDAVIIHDFVVSTEETVGDLSHLVAIVVRAFPDKLWSTDASGNLPLHKAASTARSCSATGTSSANPWSRRINSLPSLVDAAGRYSHNSGHHGVDPLEVLIQSYPLAASIPNHQGLLPLHIALTEGKRTWRSGISAMVVAAPDVLLTRDAKSSLLPFQMAAASVTDNGGDDDAANQQNTEIIETIQQLMLACPHAMELQQQEQSFDIAMSE